MEQLTKKQLKDFILDRMKHINPAAKLRFISYTKKVILYEITTKGDLMQFCPTFANVQSVEFKSGKVVYWINYDIHGYKSILSEIDFFRRFPADAEKRNIKII